MSLPSEGKEHGLSGQLLQVHLQELTQVDVGIWRLTMPSAFSAARSIRPLASVHEDELGGAAPMTHALFLPKEETLPSAPFSSTWEVGLA